MDREAWWATVHRVTKSRTRLKHQHIVCQNEILLLAKNDPDNYYFRDCALAGKIIHAH